MNEEPVISVIMPVYNAAPYLQKAIDSILNQTFSSFELLLINDCSTDNSEAIILTYTDSRIKFIKNDTNMGVVATANKGISEAKGTFVCIMHSDDVAMPERLELQANWLNANEHTAVVASFVEFINEHNEPCGEWKDDRDTVTAAEIKSMMKWRACIAHPSVMIRTEIARQYPYRPIQQTYEDYDLWLRLLSAGLVIEKIPTPLLQYRVHQTSITGSQLRKKNPYFTQYRCKINFLRHQKSIGRWGLFEMEILATALYDKMMGFGKNLKQRIN